MIVNVSLSLAQSQTYIKETGAFESVHHCVIQEQESKQQKNVNSKKKFCCIKVT